MDGGGSETFHTGLPLLKQRPGEAPVACEAEEMIEAAL